jgi:hypothetical protein
MGLFAVGEDNPDFTSSESQPSIRAVGSRITFPLVNEDLAALAPEKTGLSAQPILVDEIGLYLSAIGPSRQASLAIWSSTGALVAESATFTADSSATPFPLSWKFATVTPKILFPGTQYIVGFVKKTTDTWYFGVNQATNDVKGSSTYPLFNNARTVTGAGVINWTLNCYGLPSSPLSLVATSSDYDVELTWNAVAEDGGKPVTGYLIQRSTNGTNWTTINANTNSTSRVYNDNNLTPGFTYYYRVAALNLVALTAGAGYSGPYATASTTITEANAGNAQSLLTATVANPDPIPLQFTDSLDGIPFTDISVQYGAEYLYTQVEATTQDSFAELQLAEAPQSKEVYGVRTYSITNLLNADDLGAFEVAKDFLTYYYQPELRVESITVRLNDLTPAQKLQVLGLEIDSYISVSFTPNGLGDPKITSGLVTSISHRIELETHNVELRLRNERTLFTLDSDSRGILNVNVLGP